jgi:hypothetical protein
MQRVVFVRLPILLICLMSPWLTAMAQNPVIQVSPSRLTFGVRGFFSIVMVVYGKSSFDERSELHS